MMRYGYILSLLFPVGVLSAGCAQYAHYGEPMQLAATETVSISKVLAAPGEYDGKTIRMSGEVAEVCKNKGCWLTMTDGAGRDTIFVKFTCPVEGRLIPMDAAGHPVVVEGKFTVEEIPEAEARHYQQDAGATPEEIAKIVGPQKRLRMASPAARVEGISKKSVESG